MSRDDLYRAGVKVNSLISVFSNAEKNQGKPATKKQTSIRPNIKIFIFKSLTNEEFFNQNPTKRYLLKYNCNTNQQPFINTKDHFLNLSICFRNHPWTQVAQAIYECNEL